VKNLLNRPPIRQIQNRLKRSFSPDLKTIFCTSAWDMRLRINTEIAGALLYLHSIASPPSYHRDIISTNILLDEKYRAKLAYFGVSRIISIDGATLE